MHFQQRAGERRPEGQRQRRAHIKQPHNAGAVLLRKPLGRQVDHAREKTRFRGAQQGAHQQKLRFGIRPRHRRGEKPPQQGGAADPLSCAEFAHQQVSGHPEKGVDHKENPRPQRIGLVAQAGIQLVSLFGKADIRTVKKRQHV